MANPNVAVHCSETRLTGVLAVCNRFNPAVAKAGTQQPTEDIGVDTFEFWCPARRPAGHNFSMLIGPPLRAFAAANVVNGIARPVAQPNAWVADLADRSPRLMLTWPTEQTIGRIELSFDADFDHPAESVLMGHPEAEMPFCVRCFRIKDDAGCVVYERDDNHQTRATIRLATPITTRKLRIDLDHPSPHVPAALFEVRCYAK